MSDGITDAERMKREEVERWRIKVKEQFVSELSLSELVTEICKRDGVKEIVVPRYENFDIYSSVPEGIRIEIKNQPGPARILVVTD